MEQVKIEKHYEGVNASAAEETEAIEEGLEGAIEGALADALKDALEDLPERDGLPIASSYGPSWLALAAFDPPRA